MSEETRDGSAGWRLAVRLLRDRLWAVGRTALGLDDGAPVPSDVDAAAEMMTLHRNLTAEAPLRPGEVVQFTSAEPGEGVSTVTREYSGFLGAVLGRSVLLVDPDWYRHDPAGMGHREPLRQLTLRGRGGEELAMGVFGTGVEGVSILRALEPALPADFWTLLEESNWSRVREAAKQYDVMLLDSPPVRETKNVLLTAPGMDKIVLVVRAERTSWAVAASAKERLTRAGGRVVGLAFNDRRHHLPPWMRASPTA